MLNFFASLKRIIVTFQGATQGIASIEISFYLPVFILIMAFSNDYARFQRTSRHLLAAAQSIATALASQSNFVIKGANSNPSFFSIENAKDAINVIFPEAIEDDHTQYWKNNTNINITNVVFTPTVQGCSSSCSYNANVDWTFQNLSVDFLSVQISRSCGQLNQLAQGTTVNSVGGATYSAGIPSSLFNAGSVIVVDLQYKFVPFFKNSGLPTFVITEEAYSSPATTSTQPIPNGTASYLYLSSDTSGTLASGACTGYY